MEIIRPDLYSYHNINEDGTATATICSVPVNYCDGNNYLECDLTIIPEVNWEFEYVVHKNNFTAYFNDSTDIENYTLASFEIKNTNGISRWINYKLFGAMPTDNIISDNTIKYINVFNNIDLEYIVNTSNLKENIIIKEPIDNFNYTFTLKLDGATLELQEDGSILFIDINTNEQLWKINAPYAYDSNVSNKGPTITNKVIYSIGTKVYNGIEYQAITVALNDIDFLNNAVYPIIIDPTTTIGTITTLGNTYNFATGTAINPGNDVNRLFWIDDTYTYDEWEGWTDSRWGAVIGFNASSLATYVANSVTFNYTIGTWNGSASFVNVLYKFVTESFTLASGTSPARTSASLNVSTDIRTGYGAHSIDITALWNNSRPSPVYGLDIRPNWTENSGTKFNIYNNSAQLIIDYIAGYSHQILGVSNASKVIGVLPSKVMGI